ncbi:MAG: universal stress protein [Deltaproteobacteria bacterium]|nr:MAG: universal stress protein [Deltaproteobacteria bacterium]
MRTDPILVPLALDAHDAQIVEELIPFAQKLGSTVILMNVVQLPEGAHPYATLMMDEAAWRATREIIDEDARSQLEPLRLRLREAGLKVGHLLGHGDIIAAILAAAHETEAGLIAMGTHGRKGLERFLLGSIAEQIVRRAPCPVLVLRTPTAQG